MSETLALLSRLGIDLIWFDSLGAKSACIRVRTSAGDVVIDPGVAEMQPSYPLPDLEKKRLRREALSLIEQVCYEAKYIVITHYHYDHHVLLSDPDVRSGRKMYIDGKKMLILKDPNKYINASQWERARLFLQEVLSELKLDIKQFYVKPEQTEFEDPCEKLSIALSKSFGDYDQRRRQLLTEGKKWFTKLASELWARQPWISEIKTEHIQIVWGDGKVFDLGDTQIEILEPWFHGVEYDRTGWVTPVIIRKSGWTVFYTSDLMGPIIEDYAEYICRLRPDVVILDGPPTYLFPYMFNRINLQRAVENAIAIVKAKPKLIVYDHHLLREKRWRERTKPVFEEAEKEGVLLMTAAEVLGRKPLIDLVSQS